MIAGLLLGVSISWSVMHPTVVEPDYMRRLVEKAAEYGDVDSFEICGECNQKHGGLNGLVAYEPYPKTAAAVDRPAVEEYRRKLRETVSVAHAAGKSVYFWHREGFMPKSMLEDVPELLDEDGEYDLLGKPYLNFVRWKVREAFHQVPDLDGIVLTLTEADFSVIHNSRPERYPPVKVVETISRIFLEEHKRLGKRMIFRSFGSIESDYRDLIAGANACADDYDFEIETKITPYDFSPFLPANPYLKKTSRCTIGAECDCLGEYLGAGYLPAAQVDAIARYLGYGRAADVDRYTIRIDRVGNSIFDSAQEVNLYAYMQMIRNPSLTAEDVLSSWAEKRWPKCAGTMKELARDSFRLVEKTQFIDHNVCFHQNPPPPSFKYVKFSGIMGVFRDGMDLHLTAPMWGMMTEQKTPGRAAIRAEKAEAERLAVEGLRKLESVKDKLDPAEYARQHRAWSIAAKSVPAMRAYYDCVCAYFDDMDRNAADAPALHAAVAAAEKVILPRMTNTEIDVSSFNLNACRARGEDLDRVYFMSFLWLSRELLHEYAAEYAARRKLLTRADVVDFVVPGGIYDDIRVGRVMHSSYQNIDSGVPVRIVGNAAFPNGTITVEFKDIPGTRVEIDTDPAYAPDYNVADRVENGVRRVTISKKGTKYPGVRSIALVRGAADPVEVLAGDRQTMVRAAEGWSQDDCIDGRADREIPVYGPGEEMTFAFRLRGFSGLDKASCSFVWKRTGDDGRTEEGRAPADRELVLKTSLDRPGFVRYYIELHDAADVLVTRSSAGEKKVFFDGGAGVDIFKIRPGVPEPADFDAFWAQRKAELAAVPWKDAVKMEKINSGCPDVDLYAVSVPCAGTMPVTGFLAVPTAAKTGAKFPARIGFHGYGASWRGGAKPEVRRLRTDYVAFFCTAHGFELMREPAYYRDLRKSLETNGYGYAFDPAQNANPMTCYFLGMTYRVMRALEFLKSRPEWDGKTLLAAGGSMGGLQTIWSAALDPDVTQANPDIPWCCDIGGTEVGRNRGDWYITWAKGLGYYDPVNMAPRIRCSVSIPRFGLGDYICPPTGVMAFYNRLTCPKRATGVQNSTHGYVVPNPRQSFTLVGEKTTSAQP